MCGICGRTNGTTSLDPLTTTPPSQKSVQTRVCWLHRRPTARLSILPELRPRVAPLWLVGACDGSVYSGHVHAQSAKCARLDCWLQLARTRHDFAVSANKAWCGAAVARARLCRVRLHLQHAWRATKADRCGWPAPSASIGIDFVFFEE